jgi:protein-disulfide isomerase
VKVLERILSVTLVLAAAAIAAAMVRREFFPVATNRASNRPPAFVKDWQNILPAGRIFGDTAAPVKLFEFSDLECPACAGYHATIEALRARYQGRLAYVFVHKPLKMHRYAVEAAIAAECAHVEGRFLEMTNLIYANQESIPSRPWSAFARRAGIRDTLRFSSCVRDTTPRPLVLSGLGVADQLAITGTPTVVLNGWRYFSPPSESELGQAIDKLLAGREPNRR